MSSFNVSLLLFIFSFVSMNCLSECDFLKPNGKYEGIGVYKKYYEEGRAGFFMYNSNGIEWKFDVTDNYQKINLLQGEYKSTDSNQIKRFGILYTEGRISDTVHYSNCHINKKNLDKIVCFWNKDAKLAEHENTDLNENSLIFRPYAFRNSKTKWILIINKETTRRTWLKCPQNDVKFTTECDDDNCPDIGFIDGMNASLLSKLDGVVGFNFKHKQFFLLWFTINGRPKYCLQPENRPLSDECKSSENMTSFKDECFQSDETIATKPENSSVLANPWVLVAIIVAIIGVIVAIIVCVVFSIRRHRSDSLKSDHTLNVSNTQKRISKKIRGISIINDTIH